MLKWNQASLHELSGLSPWFTDIFLISLVFGWVNHRKCVFLEKDYPDRGKLQLKMCEANLPVFIKSQAVCSEAGGGQHGLPLVLAEGAPSAVAPPISTTLWTPSEARISSYWGGGLTVILSLPPEYTGLEWANGLTRVYPTWPQACQQARRVGAGLGSWAFRMAGGAAASEVEIRHLELSVTTAGAHSTDSSAYSCLFSQACEGCLKTTTSRKRVWGLERLSDLTKVTLEVIASNLSLVFKKKKFIYLAASGHSRDLWSWLRHANS